MFHTDQINIKNLLIQFPKYLKQFNDWNCLTDGPEFTIINGKLTKSTLSYIMKCKEPQDIYNACIKCLQLTSPSILYSTVRAINYLVNVCMLNLHNDSKKELYTYNKNKVDKLVEHFNDTSSTNCEITITMTTCKRFELFYRTINSMIECITDLDLVKEWIVVDDNSDKDLINEAKLKYPFIKWIEKTETEKGHAKSMNIILEKVTTPYFFHVEDDFEWFIPYDYLTKCKSVLDVNTRYTQCLVNIHYTEDCNTANTIWGGKLNFTKTNHYVEHVHYKNELAQIKALELGCSNNYYWPGFSFRPGLNRMSIFKKIGNFNTGPGHFEMEYGNKVEKEGYLTAFLPGTFCNHIGRRTYERNSDKLNAYDLNKVSQFGENIKNTSSSDSSGPKGTEINTPIKKDIDKETKHIVVDFNVINLKRRPDRLLEFFKKNNKELPTIHVYYGVDGSKLQPSYKLQKCFETGDYNFRKGIVGCALSHINLWKKCASDMFCDYMVILEDDAICCKNFTPKTLNLIETYKNNFDLMFLHYLPWPQYTTELNNLQTIESTAIYYPRSESIKKSMGGATGYILSREGARKLLNWVNRYGVTNGIDWVMFKASSERFRESKDLLDIMYCTPFLVFAECVQKDNRVDSDIQRDYTTCGYSNWTLSELQWCKTHFKLDYTTDDSNIVNWGKNIGLNILMPSKKNSIIFVNTIDINKHDCTTTIYCSINNTQKLSEIEPYVWYTTDKCIITVPHTMCDESFLDSHTLFNNRLSTKELVE